MRVHPTPPSSDFTTVVPSEASSTVGRIHLKHEMGGREDGEHGKDNGERPAPEGWSQSAGFNDQGPSRQRNIPWGDSLPLKVECPEAPEGAPPVPLDLSPQRPHAEWCLPHQMDEDKSKEETEDQEKAQSVRSPDCRRHLAANYGSSSMSPSPSRSPMSSQGGFAMGGFGIPRGLLQRGRTQERRRLVEERCIEVLKHAVGHRPTMPKPTSGQQVCQRSLFVFDLNGFIRKRVISLIEARWFDRVILFLIALNSFLLAGYQHRAEHNEGAQHFNWLVDQVVEPVLTCCFSVELALKVIAKGLVLDQKSYLRDPWNVLDCVVVVSALVRYVPGLTGSGLAFLRMFRALRPLRSLNAVPEMKRLVNTVVNSLPRLLDVLAILTMISLILAIAGVSLMDGIFYRQCRETESPILLPEGTSSGGPCWSWPPVASESRLCGGMYNCEDTNSFCGGHPLDESTRFRPWADPDDQLNIPWCDGSEPSRLFPETSFVHFDHIGGALLLVFQCMTMEGWTELMYLVMDSYNQYVAVLYFVLMVLVLNSFLLNVALAVVDECLDEFDAKQAQPPATGAQAISAGPGNAWESGHSAATPVFTSSASSANITGTPSNRFSSKSPSRRKRRRRSIEVQAVAASAAAKSAARAAQAMASSIASATSPRNHQQEWPDALPASSRQDSDKKTREMKDLWYDSIIVRFAYAITESEIFNALILFCILGNVVTMCFERFPASVAEREFLSTFELVFLYVFCTEMVIAIAALGPRQYWTSHAKAFDGIIVLISLVEAIVFGSGGALTAFRTLRLLRVLNKLASRWPSFRALLKAMLQTGYSLNYWLVLFMLMLFISALMFQSCFARKLHFEDVDDLAVVTNIDNDWCEKPTGNYTWHWDPEECIPRANFDTFLWAFVTIFQIMTGENWNNIMYSCMRAAGWQFFSVFFCLIFFGQILFLSLFLSILMSKFEEVSLEVQEQERQLAEERRIARGQLGATLKKHATVIREPKKHRKSNHEKEQGKNSISGAGAPSPKVMPVADKDQSRLESSNVNTSTGTPTNENSNPAIKTTNLADTPIASPRTARTVRLSQEVEIQRPSLHGRQASVETITRDHDRELDSRATDSACETDGSKATPRTMFRSLRSAQATTSLGSGWTSVWSGYDSERRRGRGWPRGYSLALFHTDGIVRKSCRRLVSWETRMGDGTVNVFDTFILVCIALSTLLMAVDDPLQDPNTTLAKAQTYTDNVFAMVFLGEMLVKLVADGLVFGSNAYLRNPWNYLDGMVVTVSVLGLLPFVSDNGFAKTLRVLRAFRPLRAISRFENLKIVVNTMFHSLPELGTLLMVSSLFLVIFALFFLAYFSGTFYHCPVGDNPDIPVALLKDAGDDFATPLCLASDIQATLMAGLASTCVRGSYNETNLAWDATTQTCGAGACGAHTLSWTRASADTPLCIGRCHLDGPGDGQPAWLCPARYTRTEELPSMCTLNGVPAYLSAEHVQNASEDELVGIRYVEAMSRELVMPCAGSSADRPTLIHSDGLASAATEDEQAIEAVSCRSIFCPNGVDDETKESCKASCKKHPHFCADTCSGSESAACKSCMTECQASCECSDYCEPIIKDAALCHEQGLSWQPSLPQSFDNIFVSVLTLFEILTTEGWVDVMYTAADSTEAYRQPVRDASQWPWALAFSLYILFMYMFILNLSVGVIVAKFLELKKENSNTMLTQRQSRWIKSIRDLGRKSVKAFFGLECLHLLPKYRRRGYEIISHPSFDLIIMLCICANSVMMAAKVSDTQNPPDWLESFVSEGSLVFTSIFSLECAFKLLVLRSAYFEESWNWFDLFSVIGSVVGIMFEQLPFLPNVGVSAVAQVIRIFRIARIFRLLKLMDGLNKVFTALMVSLVKLVNVALVLALMLVLYGVLGMNLFSSVKAGEWIGVYGNFRTFPWSLITLFRSSTGEVWNGLMHDLWKGESWWFRNNDWCTPADLYDLSGSYDVLESKCLVGENGQPNSCVSTIFGVNIWPVIFFVSYTLFITFMLFNLVVAVILEGYEEGKNSAEQRMLERCVMCWKKRDPDHRMSIPLRDGLLVINEIFEAEIFPTRALDVEHTSKALGVDISAIRIRSAAGCLDLNVSNDGFVEFFAVAKQVLRLTLAECDISVLGELGNVDNRVNPSEDWSSNPESFHNLRNTIAAQLLQDHIRNRLILWKKRSEHRSATRGKEIEKSVSAETEEPSGIIQAVSPKTTTSWHRHSSINSADDPETGTSSPAAANGSSLQSANSHSGNAESSHSKAPAPGIGGAEPKSTETHSGQSASDDRDDSTEIKRFDHSSQSGLSGQDSECPVRSFPTTPASRPKVTLPLLPIGRAASNLGPSGPLASSPEANLPGLASDLSGNWYSRASGSSLEAVETEPEPEATVDGENDNSNNSRDDAAEDSALEASTASPSRLPSQLPGPPADPPPSCSSGSSYSLDSEPSPRDDEPLPSSSGEEGRTTVTHELEPRPPSGPPPAL